MRIGCEFEVSGVRLWVADYKQVVVRNVVQRRVSGLSEAVVVMVMVMGGNE